MDELPELPFEQVLSYLSLKDRLNARTVSRAWRNTFDRYPLNTLCYSNRPIGRILGKSRWVSGAFTQNFINSRRFASFFDTFGQTILFSLKHLRLCDLYLTKRDREAFARILNSFSQLEELDVIWSELKQQDVLNLPMLTSLQLFEAHGIGKLTLEAPRLQKVKIQRCFSCLKLKIVPGESVERCLVDRWEYTDMKKLKNLQFLYFSHLPRDDPTFLSSLEHLKEIHLLHNESVGDLFEQKRRLGRANLKIYLCGLPINGPHDPALHVYNNYLDEEWLVFLAENRSILADEIPFHILLDYEKIERVAPGLEVDLLKRFIDLNEVEVYVPVRDTQRFLDLLKNCENISKLSFSCDQPQDLFDRLPEHCAVQKLTLCRAPSDFFNRPSNLAFLFRLKHLIHLILHVRGSIDTETVRRALDELPVLSRFSFRDYHQSVSIEIGHPKRFTVSVDNVNKVDKRKTTVADLNAVIEFIVGT